MNRLKSRAIAFDFTLQNN